MLFLLKGDENLSRNNLYDESVYNNSVNMLNKALLSDYILEIKSRGLSQGTIYQYTSDIKAFYCWLHDYVDNAYILDLKRRTFRQFFLALSERGTSSARVNRFQSSLRNLLEYAVEDDDEYDYDINVMKNVKGVKSTPVRDIVFLTNKQIDIILARLIEENRLQEALYLSLSYDSAARRNEVWQVEKHDFLDKNSTNEVVGKRGKKFSLLYFKRTKDIFAKYIEQRGEDDIDSLWYVGVKESRKVRSYESLYSWVVGFRDILKEETGEDVPLNPHSFRHSSLTNYEDGTHHNLPELGVKKMPLKVLKALANHDDISTTQSYLPDKDEEMLMSAFGLKM